MVGKFLNIWRLSKTFLYNTRVKGKVTRKMFKHFELNENETKHQNLRDIAKVALRGKSTALMDILENKKKT